MQSKGGFYASLPILLKMEVIILMKLICERRTKNAIKMSLNGLFINIAFWNEKLFPIEWPFFISLKQPKESNERTELAEENQLINKSEAKLPKSKNCGSRAFVSKKMGSLILWIFVLSPLLTYFVGGMVKGGLSVFILIEALGVGGVKFFKFKQTCVRCRQIT